MENRSVPIRKKRKDQTHTNGGSGGNEGLIPAGSGGCKRADPKKEKKKKCTPPTRTWFESKNDIRQKSQRKPYTITNERVTSDYEPGEGLAHLEKHDDSFPKGKRGPYILPKNGRRKRKKSPTQPRHVQRLRN